MLRKQLILVDRDYDGNLGSNTGVAKFYKKAMSKLNATLGLDQSKIKEIEFKNNGDSRKLLQDGGVGQWIKGSNNLVLILTGHGFKFTNAEPKFCNLIKTLKGLPLKSISNLILYLDLCKIHFECTERFYSSLKSVLPKNCLIASTPHFSSFLHLPVRMAGIGVVILQEGPIKANSKLHHIEIKNGNVVSFHDATRNESRSYEPRITVPTRHPRPRLERPTSPLVPPRPVWGQPLPRARSTGNIRRRANGNNRAAIRHTPSFYVPRGAARSPKNPFLLR